MTEAGIPVTRHLGLTPQSINQFGSYKTCGTDKEKAQKIEDDALSSRS
jgi:3-methyl-2-oxobutanoate hydroxymethyltransferase